MARGDKALRRIKAAVTENQNGWVVAVEGEEGREYPSAGAALSALRAIGMATAEAGTSNALVVTWEPCSRIGRQVLAVLGLARRE